MHTEARQVACWAAQRFESGTEKSLLDDTFRGHPSFFQGVHVLALAHLGICSDPRGDGVDQRPRRRWRQHNKPSFIISLVRVRLFAR